MKMKLATLNTPLFNHEGLNLNERWLEVDTDTLTPAGREAIAKYKGQIIQVHPADDDKYEQFAREFQQIPATKTDDTGKTGDTGKPGPANTANAAATTGAEFQPGATQNATQPAATPAAGETDAKTFARGKKDTRS